MTRRLIVVLGMSLAVLSPSLVAAQPATPDEPIDERAMVERFERAQQLYREGHFAAAAAILEELIAIRPEPVLYYNLARAHDGNGELKEALASYERYLELDPDVPDRGAINKRIATLKEQLVERERLAKRATTPTPTPAPTEGDDGALVIPWLMVGVGAATLIAGAVLGGLSRSERAEAEDAATHADAARALGTAEDFALGANISFVAGGLLGAAGATWLIVDAATPPAAPPDEVGLRVTVPF